MPFNLSQIFGGWRRKESRGRKSSQQPQVVGPLTRPSDELRGRKPPASHQQPKAAAPSQTKNKSELAWKLILAPHISEKSTMLGDGRYVFKVAGSAKKPSLKQAIEARYGVAVQSINILAPRDKKRRRGVILGIKPGFKKAVVALKAGQSITEF